MSDQMLTQKHVSFIQGLCQSVNNYN